LSGTLRPQGFFAHAFVAAKFLDASRIGIAWYIARHAVCALGSDMQQVLPDWMGTSRSPVQFDLVKIGWQGGVACDRIRNSYWLPQFYLFCPPVLTRGAADRMADNTPI
jgi:hypothetical protein